MTDVHGFVVKGDRDRLTHWNSRKPFLDRLDVELTERCDSNCIHCYINLPAGDPRARALELPAGDWMRIFREAAGLGALTIRMTGGEPLLREDFAELYLYARRLGLKVLLFTNARRITPELADLLARVPPLERIEVTVYGMREETYEAVTRVPGSYAGFRRGVALLLERKVPFVVKGAILPPNRGELDEFETWAATLPWMERSPSCSMFFDLRARRDSEEKNRRIGALRLSPEEGVAYFARKPESHRREMARFCARFMGPPGDRLFGCGAGRGGCVDAYGFFQPCMLVRHPGVVYDLKGGSLREALGEVFPRLRERRSVNPEYLARCARCFLKGLCEQCPGKSWAEHGTLDTPVEYLCRVAHAQARYLGLLAEGERAWEVENGAERAGRILAEVESP
jgi:radical SAM protein with 4Fe4S-binding SPASM domain